MPADPAHTHTPEETFLSPMPVPALDPAGGVPPDPGAAVVLAVSVPADATVPTARLMPGDLVELAPDTPPVRLTWLATPVTHRHLVLAGAEGLPFPLTLPHASRYRLLHGLRVGTRTCLLCRRGVEVVFDLATAMPEQRVICVACDAEVTERVLGDRAGEGA